MTERTWALVANNIVDNIIVWDGETNWSPPSNSVCIEVTGLGVGPGYTYSNEGVFVAPPLPTLPSV